MFSKWFKPRWQQRDPRSRLAAISELHSDQPEAREILTQLASDDDAAVRHAALQRLPLATVLSLPTSVDDSVWHDIVSNKIQHGELSADELLALAPQLPQHPLQQWFVEWHPNAEAVAQHVTQILRNKEQNLETILKWLRKSRHHQLGAHLINTIDDVELLQNLAKSAEQFDKRSNQLLRDRLRQCREVEKTNTQRQEQINKWLQRIEQLAQNSVHPLYTAEVKHVEQQWLDLAERDAMAIAQFNSALEKCQQKIASLVTTQSISAPVVVEETAAITPEPTPVPAAPPAIEEIPPKTDHAAKERQQQFNRQFDQLVNEVDQALQQRQRKQAFEQLQSVRQFLRNGTEKASPRQIATLQQLQLRLTELEQWQEFAVIPKLEALCAAMQALISSPLPPPERADAIRQLQDEWKSLKLPHAERAQELWTQFKSAAESAYVPCAEYFAKEKALRAHNLAQRIVICESLETYAQQDWTNVDWRAVDKVITVAEKEFSEFHPVERSEEKAIKQRFHAALSPIKDRLYGEYRRVEAAKQALIDQATQLAGATNAIDAARTMQQLQQQWKEVGHGKHHIDQKQWKAFSTAGDLVFNQRKQFFEQKHGQEQEALNKAQQIVDAISELVNLSDDVIGTTKQTFAALKIQFDDLTLPENQKAKLQKSFQSVSQQLQRHINDLPKREAIRRWQKLEELAAICQELELGASTERIQQLQEGWNTFADTALKQKMASRYETALAIVNGQLTLDLQASTAARRRLCVQLEVMYGLDSPEEDLVIRRELQLESLSRKFSAGAMTNGNNNELLDQWWLVPTAELSVQTRLSNRVAKICNS